MGRSRTLVVGMLVVGAALAACSSTDRSEMASGGSNDGGASAPRARDLADGFALGPGDDSAGGGSLAVDDGLPAVGPAVIKTGDLTVRVGEDRLQGALSEAVDVARSHGGFVLSTEVEEDGDRSGTIVLRVPAESFEEAMADARALGEVVREQVSGEDVTQEFVDLDARLRNFEAQESVLLDLMAESATVADTLRVQRELQDVQLEIERLRGRLRYLRDQTDLSTITLRLRESDPVVAGTGLLDKAWRRAVDTFNTIVSAIVVGLSVAIPISLFLVVLLLIVKLIRPRLPSFGTRDG
jgi:hypothetical protein